MDLYIVIIYYLNDMLLDNKLKLSLDPLEVARRKKEKKLRLIEKERYQLSIRCVLIYMNKYIVQHDSFHNRIINTDIIIVIDDNRQQVLCDEMWAEELRTREFYRWELKENLRERRLMREDGKYLLDNYHLVS